MTLSLALIDIILLALVLQGFVITGLLFYSSGTIKSNRWLGALVFIISAWVLDIELIRLGVSQRYTVWSLVYPHFAFAIGPVIYFYTQSLIAGRQKIKGNNLLHFLPLVIDFKAQLLYLIYNSGLLKIQFLQDFYFKPLTQHILFDTPIRYLFWISIISYAIATYVVIIKHQKSAVLSANKLDDLKWLKTIIHVMFVSIGLIIYGWDKPEIGQYTTLLPVVAAVYVLGMAAWRRQAHMSAAEKEEYTNKPAKVYFTSDEAGIYTQRLTELMTEQQLYLNPVLKVDDVAAKLLIPEKTLSNLINQHLGKNFNDFVNEYRIAEVKLKLADPRNQNFTIAAIAFDCGFNSLATFQRVFKQFTGITPSKFQNSIISNQLLVK